MSLLSKINLLQTVSDRTWLHDINTHIAVNVEGPVLLVCHPVRKAMQTEHHLSHNICFFRDRWRFPTKDFSSETHNKISLVVYSYYRTLVKHNGYLESIIMLGEARGVVFLKDDCTAAVGSVGWYGE